MASIVIAGDTSGAVTIAAPATAGTPTLTLPTTSGTLVVTGGAQTIEFAAGSAASPSITFTGDTNTGIFSPAADTIAFSEGGVESMRIDSSGRVLIGTTLTGGGLTLAKSDTVFRSGSNAYPYPSGNSYFLADCSPTNAQANWIGMNGEYGVSTGSANLLLQANFNNTNQQAGNYIASEATSATSAVLTFGRMIGGSTTSTPASKSEAMRIDSSGRLLINTTTVNAQMNLRFTGNSTEGFYINDSASSAGSAAIRFAFGGNGCGGIVLNTNSTTYQTSSDYRLKENIAPMTGALAKVAQLRPVTYNWKSDGSEGQGFIAHELQAIVPECVTGKKDDVETYTDEEGNEQTRIKPQGIDTSFLVATLTAAIQEQQAMIEELKDRINVLEGAK